jgi:hypothetical protein
MTDLIDDTTPRLGSTTPLPKIISVDDHIGKIHLSRAEDVEEFVIDEVLDFIDRKPEVAARLAAAPNPERAALRAELAELDVVIAKVSEELGAGELDYAAWESFYRPAKARADEIRGRRAQMADPDDGIEVPPVNPISECWDGLNLRQRRRVLDRFITEVRVLPRIANGPRPGGTTARIRKHLDVSWRR